MPAAPAMHAARRAVREAGFTLMELLVVILIIGIVTAGTLLSINFAGKDTELETESKRLLSLMDYAREQAELQTRDYGVFFGEHGYEFVVYDVRTGLWRPVSEDDALRERDLPSGLEFKLVVDAREIVLGDDMSVPPPPPPPGSSSSSGSDSDSGSGAAPAPQVPQPHSIPGVTPNSSGANSSSDSGSGSGSGSNSDSDSGSDAAKTFAPQVMIFSSGDLSSFTIKLERASAGRSITLNENSDGDIVQKPMATVGGST